MHNHAPASYSNPFTEIVAGNFDHDYVWTNAEDVFYQDDQVTAVVSTMHWTPHGGNAIIIANEEYENLYDIPDDLLAHTHVFSKRLALAMKSEYGCDGVTIRQHNEPAGDQDIWHYHLHVIPRYDDEKEDLRVSNQSPSDPEDRKKYAKKLRDYLNQK